MDNFKQGVLRLLNHQKLRQFQAEDDENSDKQALAVINQLHVKS